MQTNLAAFRDPSDLPQASTVDHPSDHTLEAFCPHCEHEVDAVCPHCQRCVESSGADVVKAPEGVSEFHRRLLFWLASKKNSKFAIKCFLIATGSGEIGGISMTSTAKEVGVCKATVSKYCREIVETFNLEPSRYMLSEENAAKFRDSNRRPAKPNEQRTANSGSRN